MKSKLEIKKEMLEKLIDEIEDLKKEVREELKETRAYQANKLLEKYKDDMLKISEFGKQQETIYKKIYNENYQKHEDLCHICKDLEWDDAFNEICPLAYICGYFNDGYGILEHDDECGKTFEEKIKKKVFKKEDIRVWHDEVE